MQNFIKTIINGVQSWTKKEIKNSTADWNQNDENAADYVKNRTHWEKIVEREVEFLPEHTISVEHWEEGTYGLNWEYSTELVIGQKYTITWNGITFTDLLCFDNEGYPSVGAPYMDYSEYHFGVYSYLSGDQNMLGFFTDSAEHSHTISVVYTAKETVIHKLDSKYLDLPTNLATTDDVQEAVDIANDAQNTANIALANAETAQNVIDGKMDAENPDGTGSFSMNRLAGTTVGNFSSTLGRNNIAAGVFSHVSGYYNTATGYQSVCGKFNKYESFYSIEQRTRLAPEGYYLWIDKNKPIYISNEFSFDDSTGQFSLVNPICINTDEFVNNRNYYEYYAICTWDSSNVGDATIYIKYDVTSGPNILLHSAVTAAFVTHSSYYKCSVGGIGKSLPIYYAYNKLNSVGKYAHIVGNGTSDTERSNAHTLDWNGVGWFQGGLQVGGEAQDNGARNVLLEGDAVPIPTSATVGQTIAVKSVNENGKPVEWEATDFSTSGGSGCVASDTPPEDTSILWIDTADNSDDTLQDAVNIALAQAKESGEFKGDPGKTPEKGVDYYTDTDKTELVNAVLSALPAWTGGSY